MEQIFHRCRVPRLAMCGALPQLAIVVLGLCRCTTFCSYFVLHRYVFLCYVAVFKDTFYVGLIIHAHTGVLISP